jgi:phenylacetate-CoA ligase
LRILDIYNFLKLGNSPYKELNRLKELQYSNKNDIKSLVNKKLREIILHSYENVQFYHDLYDKTEIESIKDTTKLHELTITTKPMFRNALPDKIIAKNLEARALYDVTSGSTGEPFEFYLDSKAIPLAQASYRFFNSWMGIGTNGAFIHIRTPGASTRKKSMRDWIVGRNIISVFDVNKEKGKAVVDEINNTRPVYIEGYTASLVYLANLIQENDLKIDSYPKGIIATSENLTEETREILKAVFNCNVFNRYGSREFSGAVAQECNIFEGLHINPVLCHLEIVDDNNEPVGEGEEGRILVTDLNNFVMPFIRYDIGDIAVKGPEVGECGRAFPIIKNVLGRSGQFLLTKTEVKIPLLPIMSTLFQVKYVPHVYNFQFIQERKGELTINIVPTQKFDNAIMSGIREYVVSVLPGFNISMNIVEDIPPDKSGKRQFFIPVQN